MNQPPCGRFFSGSESHLVPEQLTGDRDARQRLSPTSIDRKESFFQAAAVAGHGHVNSVPNYGTAIPVQSRFRKRSHEAFRAALPQRSNSDEPLSSAPSAPPTKTRPDPGNGTARRHIAHAIPAGFFFSYKTLLPNQANFFVHFAKFFFSQRFHLFGAGFQNLQNSFIRNTRQTLLKWR